MAFTRDEVQAAFDRYCAAAESAGATGDWAPWVDCFVPDVHYIEHLYGEFQRIGLDLLDLHPAVRPIR